VEKKPAFWVTGLGREYPPLCAKLCAEIMVRNAAARASVAFFELDMTFLLFPELKIDCATTGENVAFHDAANPYGNIMDS
jgi:hypothetical protein